MMNISSLNDNKIKNILRGIIQESESYKVKKALRKIQKQSTKTEYHKCIQIIRSNELFRHNPVTRNFIKVCPKSPLDGVSFSEDQIIEQINSEKAKLLEIIKLHIEVSKLIQKLDFMKALILTKELINVSGLSTYTIKNIYFIKLNSYRVKDSETINIKADELLNEIAIGNVDYLNSAINELSNVNTDYFNIFSRVFHPDNDNDYNELVQQYLRPIPRTEELHRQYLNSNYTFSLYDAFLYLQNLHTAKYPTNNSKIDRELNEEYKRLSNIPIENTYLHVNEREVFDAVFFRLSFLLWENKNVFSYRVVHCSLYNKDDFKELNRTNVERYIIQSYFSNIRSISDINTKKSETKRLSLEKYNKSSSDYLETSNALIYLIEKNIDDVKANEEIFVKLMSSTFDIGYTCPKSYLEELKRSAKTKEFKLVVICLIAIKELKHTTEYELRDILQDIAISNFNGELIGILEHIYHISPSVTEHLINTCDETFLSQLYKLTDKPISAIQNRADILDWYGDKLDNPYYKDRAKNLRIDIQISKEKSTIDDSRIYVDPVKFTQWICDNILNDMTVMLDQIDDMNSNNIYIVSWEKTKTGVSIINQVSSLLIMCFEEFCNNNLFGIASYLGRRIRHGTFKGTAMKEVEDIRCKEKYIQLFQNSHFNEHFASWFDCYSKMIDTLKFENLQISSDSKPDGLFIPSINTVSKTKLANKLLESIIKNYRENDSNVEIPYIITEFCWMLVEQDLSAIRKHLMESKSKYAIFRPVKNCSQYSISHKLMSDFSAELNSIVTEKFHTISSWFRKPSIASPSANLSLLIKAVISEVKDRVNDFNPTVNFTQESFEISGGEYFIIYDALYILIVNAAIHGKKDGFLDFQVYSMRDTSSIQISLCSEINSTDNISDVKRKINILLKEENTSHANIVEGDSGIHKLKVLLQEDSISNILYTFDDNKVTASFNFKVDLTYENSSY